MENSRSPLPCPLCVSWKHSTVTKEIPPLLINEWALCLRIRLFITLYSAFTSWHQKRLIKRCDQLPFCKGLSAASRPRSRAGNRNISRTSSLLATANVQLTWHLKFGCWKPIINFPLFMLKAGEGGIDISPRFLLHLSFYLVSLRQGPPMKWRTFTCQYQLAVDY